MNPPLSFSDAQTELATLTSQTANFTFNNDELTQALQTAWNDTFVCDPVLDSSLTFTDGTWEYDIPGTVNVVQDLYYRRTTTDGLERLDPSLYEVTNGQILFTPRAGSWLLTGMVIYTKGRAKLTTDDSLDTTNLINYVLYLAAQLLLTQLLFKAAFVFLRNDVNVIDIDRSLQVVDQRVIRYKQALLREFESI